MIQKKKGGALAAKHIKVLKGGAKGKAASTKATKSKGTTPFRKRSKKLLLQVKKCYYDAIMAKRKLWEARTMYNKTGELSLSAQLGTIGRIVVLHSGPGTNKLARITDVRIYYGRVGMPPIKEMLTDIGPELLPDASPTLEAGFRAYEECYNHRLGLDDMPFVALRLDVEQAQAIEHI